MKKSSQSQLQSHTKTIQKSILSLAKVKLKLSTSHLMEQLHITKLDKRKILILDLRASLAQKVGSELKSNDVYLLVTARSSGILKAKQKLGRTFNSDKLGGIAFTKISKLTMCSAYEEAQAIVPASTG